MQEYGRLRGRKQRFRDSDEHVERGPEQRLEGEGGEKERAGKAMGTIRNVSSQKRDKAEAAAIGRYAHTLASPRQSDINRPLLKGFGMLGPRVTGTEFQHSGWSRRPHRLGGLATSGREYKG